jgi:hypothetical protein
MFASLLETLSAQPTVTDIKEDCWNGSRRLVFLFAGRWSCIVLPETPNPLKPWLWRPTFLDAWPETDLCLVKKGFYLVYTEVLDFYASPEGIAHGERFYQLITSLGLARRFSFVALSRGGLFAFRYAEKYPDHIACIYADAPVCDLRSWPAGRGASQCDEAAFRQLLSAHGLTEAEVLAEAYQPLNRLGPLAEHGIPLFHVCGDADDVVPFQENTVALAEKYRALGGNIQIIVKPGVNHHPHCLENPAPVVAFIEENAAKRSR